MGNESNGYPKCEDDIHVRPWLSFLNADVSLLKWTSGAVLLSLGQITYNSGVPYNLPNLRITASHLCSLANVCK